MYDKRGLFIDGGWTAALDGKTAPVFSPVSERPLGQVAVAGVAAAEAPFGGTNHSGMGREGGIEAIRDYLDVKSSQMVWS